MLASGKSLTESQIKPHPGDPRKRILVILSTERIMQRLFGARTETGKLSLPCYAD